ncbi:hypothetical protein [Tenacibaculum soleae]|uniref:hypothetical protein n=1 Tax=Tenacibaculum soleae TaxID=447689 RepID=UPI0026E29E3D|nr:hypothetical protein [Tenacibaculum soleae]MDO6814028.1 hypothetical protein [Tenacibaculum soleae]
MKKNNLIFEKEQSLNGVLNFLAIILIVFGGIYYSLNNTLLSLFLTLIICFFLFILLNKKWFKTIKIKTETILISYPLNFFGAKEKQIDYDENIIEVIYYGYMYRTPSHCKILMRSNKSIRFNCTLKEANKIFDFLKTKNVYVVNNDEKNVGYR